MNQNRLVSFIDELVFDGCHRDKKSNFLSKLQRQNRRNQKTSHDQRHAEKIKTLKFMSFW